MCCGDTSNNSEFYMPTHYGTHIDYPYHFSSDGKTSSDYNTDDFMYNEIQVLHLHPNSVVDYIVRPENIQINNINTKAKLVLLKTGFCNKRYTDEYWERGFGLAPEVASFLKQTFPFIKTIGIDLISLNSFQNRPLGRIAHKSFLIEQDILIVEEVDMRKINQDTLFKQIIIAPLLLEEADGAPVTILAEVYEN